MEESVLNVFWKEKTDTVAAWSKSRGKGLILDKRHFLAGGQETPFDHQNLFHIPFLLSTSTIRKLTM